jgi:hypothetical protein
VCVRAPQVDLVMVNMITWTLSALFDLAHPHLDPAGALQTLDDGWYHPDMAVAFRANMTRLVRTVADTFPSSAVCVQVRV